MVGHQTFSRGDWGSKPPASVLKLRQFSSSHFACVFYKRRQKLVLSLVSTPVGVKDSTQGNDNDWFSNLTV